VTELDHTTAQLHGICPVCQGYGGRSPDPCTENVACGGSCELCRCPGCWDGALPIAPPEGGELLGSWAAYEAVQRHVNANQLEQLFIPGSVDHD
jgi:hypothetical protein